MPGHPRSSDRYSWKRVAATDFDHAVKRVFSISGQYSASPYCCCTCARVCSTQSMERRNSSGLPSAYGPKWGRRIARYPSPDSAFKKLPQSRPSAACTPGRDVICARRVRGETLCTCSLTHAAACAITSP